MAALAADAAIDLDSVPTVESVPQFQGSTYDFASMPSLDLNLAQALDDDNDSDALGFFQALVKGFGG